MNSRKLARLVGDLSRLQLKAKRKAAAFVGKQRLRVPDKQANSLHPPRTDEQPQACSIGGRRSLTASTQRKEEGAGQLLSASSSSKQVLATQAHSLHSPHTDEQPQACWIG